MKRCALKIATILLCAIACGESNPVAPTDLASARTAAGTEVFDGVGRVVWVTNNADVGPGSLRAAVEEANGDAAVRGIRFAPSITGQIEPRSQIVYDGAQPLTVEGPAHIVTLGAPGVGLLFRVRSALTLRGFGVEDANKVGLGIMVQADAVGEVRVDLERMGFLGVYSHAVWITDQDVPESDPTGFSDAGSPASLRVRLHRVRVTNTAFEPGDDGVRISEGGAGDLHVTIDSSVVQWSGGGVNLDERGDGDLIVAASHSVVEHIAWRLGAPSESALVLKEAGAGDIDCRLRGVDIYENTDDGLEIEEVGAGDVTLVLSDITIDANGGRAISIIEDADGAGTGDVSVDFVDVAARTNALESLASAVVHRAAWNCGSVAAKSARMRAQDLSCPSRAKAASPPRSE
ncbi:MAG: hypothetical protein IT357_15855, partial [Gemmatimonadaceae bacterium]|nr:hypothetical protein [Gemmatimonadaceae bacterium]